jgi:hypothetical protein
MSEPEGVEMRVLGSGAGGPILVGSFQSAFRSSAGKIAMGFTVKINGTEHRGDPAPDPRRRGPPSVTLK